MAISRIAALTSLLVVVGVTPAWAQLTPGFDPDADYCRYEAPYSWYQRHEMSAPERWGKMAFDWRLTAGGGAEAGAVTSWEWHHDDSSLYSQLDTNSGLAAPRMTSNPNVSPAWRLTIAVTPNLGNAVAAELRSIGGVASTQWVFGGLLMQSGARPFTSIGAISCGKDPR